MEGKTPGDDQLVSVCSAERLLLHGTWFGRGNWNGRGLPEEMSSRLILDRTYSIDLNGGAKPPRSRRLLVT